MTSTLRPYERCLSPQLPLSYISQKHTQPTRDHNSGDYSQVPMMTAFLSAFSGHGQVWMPILLKSLTNPYGEVPLPAPQEDHSRLSALTQLRPQKQLHIPQATPEGQQPPPKAWNSPSERGQSLQSLRIFITFPSHPLDTPLQGLVRP